MLTSYTKYQVFVLSCYSSMVLLFLNPTAVEFYHPQLDHFCCKLSYDQNFNISSYFNFHKWILI